MFALSRCTKQKPNESVNEILFNLVNAWVEIFWHDFSSLFTVWTRRQKRLRIINFMLRAVKMRHKNLLHLICANLKIYICTTQISFAWSDVQRAQRKGKKLRVLYQENTETYLESIVMSYTKLIFVCNRNISQRFAQLQFNILRR